MPQHEKIDTWMFRRRDEIPTLLISILIVTAVMYGLYSLNVYVMLGYIVITLIYIRLMQAQYLGNSLKVGPNQFPELYEILAEYCAKLNVHRVSLYISQDPYPNAFTFGFLASAIVVHSAIIENLSRKEIEFVIAHELGHIKAGHTVILSLISPLDQGFLFSNLMFSFWSRVAEYTCDRCAIALTKDLEAGVTALLKIGVGVKLLDKVNIAEYRNQLIVADNHASFFSELLLSHPLISNRIRKMIEFKKETIVSLVNL